MKKSIIILIIFFGGLLMWKFFQVKNVSEENLVNLHTQSVSQVEIAGKNIKVEVADNDFTREKGLSGHQPLKDDEGMLFIFDRPHKYSFWMKEMLFPIDIIWIADDFSVIYIKKNAEPSSYPETFEPDLEARYVLEVNAGFSEKNNLKVGDYARILP